MNTKNRSETKFTLYVLILLLTLLLGGCVNALFTGANLIYDQHTISAGMLDYKITKYTEKALAKYPLINSNSHIKITVFQRMLLITGETTQQKIRKQITTIAEKTPRVRYVVNDMIIGKPAPDYNKVTDMWLSTNIKTRFILAGIGDPDDIKIVVYRRTVYLMGVLRRNQENKLVRIARNTRRVRKVVKMLETIVVPQAGPKANKHKATLKTAPKNNTPPPTRQRI